MKTKKKKSYLFTLFALVLLLFGACASSKDKKIAKEQQKRIEDTGALKETEIETSDNSPKEISNEDEIRNLTNASDDGNLGIVGADFQPRIYYYNSDIQGFEELENQIVEDRKVTVFTDKISKHEVYILLNKVEYDAAWWYEE